MKDMKSMKGSGSGIISDAGASSTAEHEGRPPEAGKLRKHATLLRGQKKGTADYADGADNPREGERQAS